MTEVHTGQKAGSYAQTLSRGVEMLKLVAEAHPAPTIDEVTEQMGVHRSVVYRILRTLEDHALVRRDDTGRIRPGIGLVPLALAVESSLQSAALPVLTDVANELDMSTFVAVAEHQDCYTLLTVEPARGHAVTQRPGTRHPLEHGAPGLVVLSQLEESLIQQMELSAERLQRLGWMREHSYATSGNEVIPGVSSVAVPLVLAGQPPSALAVVYPTQEVEVVDVVARLRRGADQIRSRLGG